MPTLRKTKDKANHIDISVGQNLKLLRRKNRLSQKELADNIGITFQQLQKYETGKNRISASRLYDIANSLEVSILDLYGGVEEGNKHNRKAVSGKPFSLDKQTLELVSIFQKIQDENLKRDLLNLLKRFSQNNFFT